jgi:hypothetical protein
MKTSLSQTSVASRRPLHFFSGSAFGRRWSISILPRGIVWEEELDELPEAVGTQEIVLPAQSVQLKFDFEHLYMTGADNRAARCHIRVYGPTNILLQGIGQAAPVRISLVTYSSQEPTIVLCEPTAIGGITTRAEEMISTAVWHQLGRPRWLTWIEHWWKSDASTSCEFQLVRFRVNARGVLVEPQWTEVQRTDVEQLIGPVEELQQMEASWIEERSARDGQ